MICPGCGLQRDDDGPGHAYLAASPGCWAAFGRHLALHYSDRDYWAVHGLLTDAYCLQHSVASEDRRVRRSAAVHLAALRAWEAGGDEAAMLSARRSVPEDRQLDLPAWDRVSATITDVPEGPDAAAHHAGAERYAKAVLADCDRVLGDAA